MEEKNIEEYEIDLRQIVNIIWSNKWLIIGLCIVALVASLYYTTNMVTPRYQAKSTLLILPPKYKTSLQVSTLPIDTYKSLLLTPSMKVDIIKELDLRKEDGTVFDHTYLDNRLSVEVQANKSGNMESNPTTPLLILKVRGKDPEVISSIANVWAQKFIKTSEKIRKGEVQQISAVITNQYNETKKKLNTAKQDLKDFKKDARIDLAKMNLNIKKENLNKSISQSEKCKTELGSEQVEYDNLKERIKELETDGYWLGGLKTDLNLENNNLSLGRKNLITFQQRHLNFLKDHDFDLIKQKIAVKKGELKTYQQRVISLETSLKENKIEMKELNSIIKTEPEKWSVDRSMTTDSVWNKILDEEEIATISNLKLSNELISPIYRKLKDGLSDAEIQVNTLPTKIEYYKQLVVKAEEELKELNISLEEWGQEKSNIENDLLLYKHIYKQHSSKYESLKSKLLSSNLRVNSLKVQMSYYNNRSETLKNEIKTLENQIWEDEIVLESLHQEVNNTLKTYNQLSTKMEEVRITEAEKTSDVKFIAQAVPPTRPLGTNKKFIIAFALMLALSAGIFIVFFKEYLVQDKTNLTA